LRKLNLASRLEAAVWKHRLKQPNQNGGKIDRGLH